jgi:hypothetical protein
MSALDYDEMRDFYPTRLRPSLRDCALELASKGVGSEQLR